MSDTNYQEYLQYDPVTGNFFRKKKLGRWAAGSQAGSLLSNGHLVISLFGKSISGRKLAWFLHYGEWPETEVLSLNGKPADLRISNLSLAGSGSALTHRQLLEYCEYSNGTLYRINSAKGATTSTMGSLGQNGYLETSVMGKRYLVHRLVWFYHHGVWPKLVDHINSDRTDNRIENLRAADYLENAWNTKATSTRELPRGVDMPDGRSQEDKPYRMRLRHKGKVYRDYFKTPEEAAVAYEILKRTLCGEWSPV